MIKFKGLWGRLFGKIKLWLSPTYRTILIDDQLPQQLKRHNLYVVQEDGFTEQAALLCPCGCNHLIQLNLQSDERPCWRIRNYDNQTSTLRPSVWRKDGCASHFWFRNGKVVWCSKGLPPPNRNRKMS